MKRNLKQNIETATYNDMLSSLAYGKFREYLSAQAKVKGLEIRKVNPVYTSLIGRINYTKPLGLSVHQAASYVIARRGLLYPDNIKSKTIEEKIEQNEKIEYLIQSTVYAMPCIVNNNAAASTNIKADWNKIQKLYKKTEKSHYKEKLLRVRKRKSRAKPGCENSYNLDDIF